MDRMLYIGMNGAKETLYAQGLNNHNMANANTTGFRADLEQFRSMPVFGPGHPSRAYAMTERPATDFSQGGLQTTDRPLDMAIKGDGWFVVQAPDGGEAYTRAGDLHIDAQGFLRTGTGLRVMGNGEAIVVPPADSITVGTDGTITIQPQGQAGAALAEIDRIRMVNPGDRNLEKGTDGLMRMRDGTLAPIDINVRAMSGTLERSNVNVVEAMTRMITMQRNFDMQTKIMKTAQEVDKSTDGLMRLS
jgi:flagellar basal-body rod protein FlgF